MAKKCCNIQIPFVNLTGIPELIQKVSNYVNLANCGKYMKDSNSKKVFLYTAKDFWNCNLKHTSIKWSDIKRGDMKIILDILNKDYHNGKISRDDLYG